MILFLAEFKFEKYEYMGETKTDKNYSYRLVRAKDEHEAKEKIKDKYEYSSEGGGSRSVIDFSATKCIE